MKIACSSGREYRCGGHRVGPMRLSAILLALLMAAAVACAPSRAEPAPLAPAEAQGWQAEWGQLVRAAKREGQVAVVGPASADAREVLTRPFEEKYGVTVEYLGLSARELVPRVRAEREAGQYLWDVIVQGAMDTGLYPLGALAPMEPALILPEVKDPANWRGGQIEFLDPEHSILVMTPFQRGTVFVNPNTVRPEEIKSYRDLLAPRFKGKMVVDDPRASGPGQATFTFFYLHPELGPDYIRALAKQEPLILRNFQQEVDMVAQGHALVAVGTADFIAEARMKEGVPIAIVDPRQLKEGSDVNPANGTAALFDRVPHPNAAKLYLNWLLSRDGQTAFAKGLGYVSARIDTPTDHALPWRVPQPDAIKTYLMEVRRTDQQKMVHLAKELFGE